MSEPSPNASQLPSANKGDYVVIARRYRPQQFEDLIGQEHIARALSNAITTDRVGHAYLFTGARGVGKTSASRILAKALNCQQGGPTPHPCNKCDICESVSSGDDVDVLEIDGASNRGIDEIRQLRQNVAVRPSRAKFKVYIIDEVHMLTREAFNALLKTLEEPPSHVKFIFCTTEPTKIPVTILSRCQRFDFAGIQWDSIAECLRKIVDAEGVEADPEAIQALARRATGSMRDAQSLLEQLLAFAPSRITMADVDGMLGAAGAERLATLVDHLVRRDPAGALAEADAAVHEGVDLGLLLEQLFGYFRDCMAAAAGCKADLFLYAAPGDEKAVAEIGAQLGMQTVLAVMQILDHTLGRLRYSTQARTLTELALVRICCLEDLDEIPALLAQLQSGSGGGAAASGSGAARSAPRASRAAPRSTAPRSTAPRSTAADRRRASDRADNGPDSSTVQVASDGPVTALTPENAEAVWRRAIAKMSKIAADQAGQFESVAISAPNRLVIRFQQKYNFAKSMCERPDQAAKLEQALAEEVGQPVRVEFALTEGQTEAVARSSKAKVASSHQQLMEVAQRPIIRCAGELFGATPSDVLEPPSEK